VVRQAHHGLILSLSKDALSAVSSEYSAVGVVIGLVAVRDEPDTCVVVVRGAAVGSGSDRRGRAGGVHRATRVATHVGPMIVLREEETIR
jgi:hypothetical protein